MKLSSLALLACLAVSPVFAGGESDGGGSMVQINGEWTLSDYFGPYRVDGQPYKLTGEPKQAMLDIIDSVAELTLGDDFKAAMVNLFIDNAEYVFTKTLPCNDQGKDIMYGCTKDGVTYLIEKLFNKLSNQDRIFALMHERLHTLPNYDHSIIQPYIFASKKLVTSGLDKAMGSDTQLIYRIQSTNQEICKREYSVGCLPQDTWTYIQPSVEDLTNKIKLGAKITFLKTLIFPPEVNSMDLGASCDLAVDSNSKDFRKLSAGRQFVVFEESQTRNYEDGGFPIRNYFEVLKLKDLKNPASFLKITCREWGKRTSYSEFVEATKETLKITGELSADEVPVEI